MIYLNNLKSINFDTKIISDPAHAIGRKLSDSALRIKDFAIQTFDAIYLFFSNVIASLLPIKNNVVVNVEKDEPSLLGKLFERSLIVAENANNESINLKPLEEKSSDFMVDATYVYVPICNIGIPSLILTSGINQSLLGTLSTISMLQQSCFNAFKPCVDETFLKNNQLTLSERDMIDHGLFLGALHIGGSILSTITINKIDKPIHLALAIICTVSPIEERFFENSLVKQVSETVHEITFATREIIKKPIKKAFKNYLISQLKINVLPLVNEAGKNFINDDNDKKNLTKHSLLERTIASFGGAFLEYEIVEGKIGKLASEAIGNSMDCAIEKIAESVSDLTVDVGTSVLKYSAQGYLLNQALNAAYASNPLITSLSMIVEGGPRQDIYELSRRVLAVGVFVLTNSSFWPLLIINVPPTINYLMTIRNTHLKNQGFEKDPLAELIHETTEPYLSGLKNLIGWTTHQETKKMNDIDQKYDNKPEEKFLKQPSIETKEEFRKPEEKFLKHPAFEKTVQKFALSQKASNNKGFFSDILGALNHISH